MPLSELHRMVMRHKQETTQPKMTSGTSELFPIPEDEFAEPIWKTGKIVMQNQPGKARKNSFASAFSTQYGRGVREADTRGSISSKLARFGEVDPTLDDFAPSSRSVHTGSNACDDDTVPWISCRDEEDLASAALENDYCAEFLNEFLGFDPSPLSAHKNTIAAGRSAGVGQVRNSCNAEREHASEAGTGSSESVRNRTSQLFQLSQQRKSSVPNSKSPVVDVDAGGGNAAQEDRCKILASPKQLQQPSNAGSLMNFSHFARPVALAKVGLQNVGGLRRTEKFSTLSSSNPVASMPIEIANGTKDIIRVPGQSASVPHEMSSGSTMKTPQQVGSVKQSNEICPEDALRKNDNTGSCSRLPDNVANSSFTASVALSRHEFRKDPEAVVASSSMCSENFTGAASHEPKNGKKRKVCEEEESEYHSEDLEDESVGMRRPANGRGNRAKRSRDAEVHNLSEKRRRNKINEKMRALQDLIPNCDKVDKASVLDEAIEYLKTLQLQVQIMCMGSGLFMPPMMLPPATMAQFPAVGLGMRTSIGSGFGMGMYGMRGIPIPQFPLAPTSGQSGSNGMRPSVSPQMCAVQGRGAPVLMSPPFSTLPGLSMKTSSVPGLPNADTATKVSGYQQQQDLT